MRAVISKGELPRKTLLFPRVAKEPCFLGKNEEREGEASRCNIPVCLLLLSAQGRRTSQSREDLQPEPESPKLNLHSHLLVDTPAPNLLHWLYLYIIYVCVLCVCTCVCMCVSVCMYVCVEARSSHWAFLSIILYPPFWDRVYHWTWSLTYLPDCLTSKPLKSASWPAQHCTDRDTCA